MAKKSSKKTLKPVRPQLGEGVEILNAGSVLEDPITRTLETNYMPYAMSVIVSRALPEIDGFKPAHRKLLYTMYEMGLIKGARTKSRQYRGPALCTSTPTATPPSTTRWCAWAGATRACSVPFVDSKGNFGKAYSRDMSCAAARYTEAKLESVCEELFRDIDKETVDFVPNYDGTTTEPTLLPVTFPTILANNTLGIAVGMACNICSFNLAELCNTTIALHEGCRPRHRRPPCPPRISWAAVEILYDEAQMRDIFENGRGSVKVRATLRRCAGRKYDRDHPDPAHHHGGSHHGQDRRAGQDGQGQGDQRYARRDRPERPQAHPRPQAGRGRGQADGQALQGHPAGRQLQLQLQHPRLGPAPGHGRAGDLHRSGRPSGWSASAAAPTTTSTARKSASTCSRVWRRF